MQQQWLCGCAAAAAGRRPRRQQAAMMMGRRQLQTPAGGATATGAATAQAALTVAAGAGSLALAGHVGSQWRRHGLGEAWRKSLHRKGTAFRLHQTGRWLGIYSGLLHFVAVWRMRGLIGVSSTGPQTDEGRARRTRQELREREADLHGWFWLRTGEVNSAQAKLEKSRKQQAGWEQRLLGGSGQASAAGPATENQAAAAAAAPESAMATATIRREDVARHFRREDCWFIIRGKVYDLTSWLREHPGGAAVLLQHAGQDATAAFAQVEHSLVAWRWLRRHQIGVVDSAGEAADARLEFEKGRRVRARASATRTSSVAKL